MLIAHGSALVWAGVLIAGTSISARSHNNQVPLSDPSSTPKRVAIIGAGAAGTSTAYHLRKFASSASLPLDITIYESNSYIGGRSTTVFAYDDVANAEHVELGGSIFVKVNKILYDATAEFNLTAQDAEMGRRTLEDEDEEGPLLGVWDGNSFVYEQESDGWWDIAKMVWKYGLSPLRAQNAMKDVVGKFLKMYEAPRFPWVDLAQVIEEVGLSGVVSSTGQDFLQSKGVSDAFARDIVQAATRVNYAQNLVHIHGVESMVCLATDGAMSVANGNWQIFQHMAKSATEDILLNTTIQSIKRLENGMLGVTSKLNVEYIGGNGLLYTIGKEWKDRPFDAVVLAAPYQYAGIEFEPKLQYVPEEVPYVSLHVTLFTSPHRLSASAFGLGPDKQAPRVILTTLESGGSPGNKFSSVGKPGFFSISTLRTIINPQTAQPEYLYKIFSPTAVNSTFLSHILGLSSNSSASSDQPSKSDVTWIHRKVWNSYPHEFPRSTFEKLRLDQNVWYTSGIENFISTMETSALSGMNVARLIVDGWSYTPSRDEAEAKTKEEKGPIRTADPVRTDL